MNRSRVVASLVAALLLAPSVSAAQGSISGTVIAKGAGGVVCGVRVTASGVDVTRTSTTDNQGQYSIPDLPPGLYTVQVKAPGFNDLKRSAVRVAKGNQAVDLELTIANLEEVIVLTEPAVLAIEELFRKADVVALVRILAGDMEGYQEPIYAVYKAEVLTGYKGVKSGGTLSYGPFVGGSIGKEYVLFLSKVAPPVRIGAQSAQVASDASSPFYGVMLDGCGSLDAGYVCVFEERGGTPCADGLHLCWHVTLPKTVKLYDKGSEGISPGQSWAHREEVLAVLEKLSKSSEGKPTTR
jgi:hypothetical protein